MKVRENERERKRKSKQIIKILSIFFASVVRLSFLLRILCDSIFFELTVVGCISICISLQVEIASVRLKTMIIKIEMKIRN